MGMYSCPCLFFVAFALALPACSKKDSDAASPPSPATAPATTQSAPITDDFTPPRQATDPRLQSHLYVTVNNHTATDVPQGWPVIITVSAFGSRSQPLSLTADDVTLTVTDYKKSPVTWPLKRSPLRPTTQPATDSTPIHFTWALADTTSIPLGFYQVTAISKSAAAHPAALTITTPPKDPTPEQQSNRFALQARTALALGDPQAALDQADTRLKSNPTDLPALHVRADALAALGKTDEAIAAYSRALEQFYAQNPHAPEPPTMLLQSLRQLTRGK